MMIFHCYTSISTSTPTDAKNIGIFEGLGLHGRAIGDCFHCWYDTAQKSLFGKYRQNEPIFTQYNFFSKKQYLIVLSKYWTYYFQNQFE